MPLQNRQTALTRADARADDQRREIAFGNQSVVIARRVSGIAMRVRVPLCSYRGVALSLAEDRDGEAVHRIALLHRDPDLSIPLAETVDLAEIAAEWTAWAEGLALPRLIERAPGEIEAVEAMGPGALPAPRRRGSAVARRRTRFSRRRRMGTPARLAITYRGEREIISYE
ncbi:MAG TPA: DUF6101 family protein [Beijerinckiaceae bacterium]|jgi:hypothetical protein|nr:DUF6101 family protein [Beijerinckiaceae bacterium]